MSKINSIDDFLALLKSVKPYRNGYMALCPGHADHIPSLLVEPKDGKIHLNCWAGCSLATILRPLNLETKDLYLNHNRRAKRKTRQVTNAQTIDTQTAQKIIDCIYQYDGFEVVRYIPKDFSVRRPDGNGGFIWNITGIIPNLYHQNELLQAVANGKTIWVAEGEKDCDRLRGEGFIATCNPFGAGKWLDSHSEALQGADLVILPDNESQVATMPPM